MIGLLRAIAVAMAMVPVIDCSDRGGAERVGRANPAVGNGASAFSATTVAEQTRGFARTDGGAFVGFHQGPQFSSTIDDNGARLAGLDEKWTLGLHVARIGREGAMREVGRSAPSASKERVEVARGGGVTEWYAHRERGLEHGVDVSAPPAGAGELVIEVAVDGRTPVAATDCRHVELRDAAGAMTLTYGGLSVTDALGRDVAARMGVVGSKVTIAVRDEGARYPLVVDPLVWKQQAKLLPLDWQADNQFGYSVALSGSTAIVGAYGRTIGSKSEQGAAYVFVRSGTTWTQEARLLAADGAAGDRFGTSVALSGSTALVGAPQKKIGYAEQGAAYLFVQSGMAWTQQARLAVSEGFLGDHFGSSVAVSGSTAIVGARDRRVGSNSQQGAMYVFLKSGLASPWGLQIRLGAGDGTASDHYGSSMAFSGSTAVIGAPTKGTAYIWIQSAMTWNPQARLAAEGAVSDSFGDSVAISGSTALVGAPSKECAYVFVQSGTSWIQKARLVAKDGVAGDSFGGSVAISGSTAIVGAYDKKAGSNRSGAAYVFVQSGTTWTQQERLVAADGAKDNRFGSSIALDGSTAMVGANGKGAAYAFLASPLVNGEACALGADCASGQCVGTICCDRACNSRCEACTAAKKGTGVDGSCGFVVDGSDPNVTCEPPTCAAGGLTEHVCDGKGACRAKTSTCAPFTCDPAGKECRKNCAASNECSTGLSCVGGVCGKGPRCSDDRRRSSSGNGAATPCEPYFCDAATGLCAQSCNHDSDCASDNVCSENRTCGPLTTIRGCGCALPGATKHGDDLWPIAAFGALACWQYKRRRARRG